MIYSTLAVVSISEIANWVIIIGAVTVAILNILKFFGKPAKYIKRKRDEDIENLYIKFTEELLPTALERQYPILSQENHAKQFEERFTELSIKLLPTIMEERDFCSQKDILKRIYELNEKQNILMERMDKSLRDLLRQRIVEIYDSYKDRKVLPFYMKELLDELYQDYKNQEGNGYIDRYYNRMNDWKIDLELRHPIDTEEQE